MTADVFTLFARSANLEEGIGRTIGEGKWGKGRRRGKGRRTGRGPEEGMWAGEKGKGRDENMF